MDSEQSTVNGEQPAANSGQVMAARIEDTTYSVIVEARRFLYHCEDSGVALDLALAIVEREGLIAAIKAARGNQCRAAQSLGVHRNTMARRMAALGIRPPRHWSNK